MQVVLVMFRNDGERRSFSVVRNMTVIGRREDCDLRIPVGDVSRKHCRILTSDDGISIEDLGSSNGTYVNQERVQQRALNPGDTIGVGPVQFVVQIDGVPGDDEMTAPNAAASTAATVDDSDAGYHSPAALEEEPLLEEDELLAEADEPLAELPAEELAEDEEPLEELPAEELTAEELSEEELPEHAPAAALTEETDELDVEESPLAEQPIEHLEELEETIIPEEELEEAPLAAHATDIGTLEDLELDEASSSAPIIEDELDELPLPPPAHADEAVEELELDEDGPVAASAHPAEKPEEGSAWDFVIEETESERSAHPMHVDLDAPHQQPHQ